MKGSDHRSPRLRLEARRPKFDSGGTYVLVQPVNVSYMSPSRLHDTCALVTHSVPDFEFDGGVFIKIDSLSQECGFAQSAPSPLLPFVFVSGPNKYSPPVYKKRTGGQWELLASQSCKEGGIPIVDSLFTVSHTAQTILQWKRWEGGTCLKSENSFRT